MTAVRYDVLGLGKDAPMYGSNNTDAFEVINPATKQFVTLRVPYPLGFFPRSANGRVDDPRTGSRDGRQVFAGASRERDVLLRRAAPLSVHVGQTYRSGRSNFPAGKLLLPST